MYNDFTNVCYNGITHKPCVFGKVSFHHVLTWSGHINHQRATSITRTETSRCVPTHTYYYSITDWLVTSTTLLQHQSTRDQTRTHVGSIILPPDWSHPPPAPNPVAFYALFGAMCGKFLLYSVWTVFCVHRVMLRGEDRLIDHYQRIGTSSPQVSPSLSA